MILLLTVTSNRVVCIYERVLSGSVAIGAVCDPGGRPPGRGLVSAAAGTGTQLGIRFDFSRYGVMPLIAFPFISHSQ